MTRLALGRSFSSARAPARPPSTSPGRASGGSDALPEHPLPRQAICRHASAAPGQPIRARQTTDSCPRTAAPTRLREDFRRPRRRCRGRGRTGKAGGRPAHQRIYQILEAGKVEGFRRAFDRQQPARLGGGHCRDEASIGTTQQRGPILLQSAAARVDLPLPGGPAMATASSLPEVVSARISDASPSRSAGSGFGSDVMVFAAPLPLHACLNAGL